MTKQSGITHAQLEWRNAVTPVSNAFDDVYFSKVDGAQESEYVFLHNNQLSERWSRWSQPHFVVAETGFGTGLNFLLTWLAFHAFRRANPDAPLKRLFFSTIEKFPLSRADLETALACWPQLSQLTAELLVQYPKAVPGCHRMLFDDGAVILDLWLGDVNQLLPTWVRPQQGLVDAFFLDGFAPSKNPEMWREDLYLQMARLGRSGATFATFTAAGAVRRGLQAAGFEVEKVAGFGTKREMLRGTLSREAFSAAAAPMLSGPYRWPDRARPEEITIIGGGVASAALALALVRRRIKVTLLCQDSAPAQGASGNRQGALYPLLHVEYDKLSEFFSQAFSFARREIDTLLARGGKVDHDWCGVLQLAFNDKSAVRRDKLLAEADYCRQLLEGIDAGQASKLAGVPLPHDALFYPDGGWLSPPQLVQALLDDASNSGLLTLRFNTRVEAIQRVGDRWQLQAQDGTHDCQNLVVANGHRCTGFAPLADLAVTPVRGQVSHVDATPETLPLKTVLCYEGYFTPQHQQQHCLGASFKRNTDNDQLSAEEQQENLDKLLRCIAPETWARSLQTSIKERASIDARVGFRCASRDHLPLFGPVHSQPQSQIAAQTADAVNDFVSYQPGLYVLTGLGSRGLCSAQYAAELLASSLCDEPLPAAQALMESLHPSRLALRQALRRKG